MNAEEIQRLLPGLGDLATVLRDLFGSSTLPLQVYRHDGRCLLVNDAFRRLFGSEPPPDYTVFKDDIVERSGVLDQIRRAFAGEPVHVPPLWYDPRELHAIKVTQGRRVGVETDLIPLRDVAGFVAFVLVIFHDRTEEMLAQEQLAVLVAREQKARAETDEERKRLLALLEQAPANITMHQGPDLVFVLSNAQHQALTGHRSLLGKPLAEAMPELRDQDVVRQLGRVYETGEPVAIKEFEAQVKAADGELQRRFFDLVWQPFRASDGRIEGVMTFSHDVTELVLARREAEQLALALRESEELFRVAQEQSPHGFAYHRSVRDEQGEVVDFEYIVQNAAAAAINRLPAGRAVAGKRMLEQLPALRSEPIWQHLRRVAETGEAFEGEIRYPEGRLDPWLQLSAVRVGDGVAVTFQDITARKAAEAERLRLLAEQKAARLDAEQARERLDAVYRQAPVAIAVWRGPDHLFELANPSYLRSVGRTSVVGQTLREVFRESDFTRRGTWDVWDQVYRTGERFSAAEYEVSFDRRGEGVCESGFFSFTLDPLRDAEGAIVGLLGIGRDVTDQVQARVQLQSLAAQLGASEERFRVVQENSPDGFMIFRSVRGAGGLIEDFTWVYTNPAAERIVGKSSAALEGKRLLSEMPGNKEEGLFDAYVGVVETGEVLRRELRYSHEGLSHGFRVLALRLGDGFAVTFEDVTDRMRAEAERDELLLRLEAARQEAERQREQAEAANELKDEFLATISHELRTPLQSILGWAKILREDQGQDPDRLTKGLQVIDRNAHAQAHLIEDILDVSRIITGKLRLAPREIAVTALLDAAVDTLRAAAEAKRITLTVDAGVDIGTITADPDRLQQIVWNLVANAVKFTPARGQVHVRARRHEGLTSIVVSDTGRGISAEFLPHVFERFRQADGSTARAQTGLGLGLAIVRHLVELHGGRVSVASAGEGQGATFTVELPVESILPPDELGDVRLDVADSVRSTPPRALLERRVLLVDDDDDAREILAAALRGAGAQVEEASSVAQAMDSLRVFRPAAVVSDIGMPGEDGYTLLRRIRTLDDETLRGVAVVALTAYARAQDRARALREGFQGYLAKPIKPDALIAVVARLFD